MEWNNFIREQTRNDKTKNVRKVVHYNKSITLYYIDLHLSRGNAKPLFSIPVMKRVSCLLNIGVERI